VSCSNINEYVRNYQDCLTLERERVVQNHNSKTAGLDISGYRY
jgi:hypothetical protein